MSGQQLEIRFESEQNLEAELIKETIKTTNDLINSAEKIHRITMDTLRSRLSNLQADLKKKCSHPKTEIKDDFNYHRNEEWQLEVCAECGLVLRRW